jgi:transcriptional regulator with XRE-family HTH domain
VPPGLGAKIRRLRKELGLTIAKVSAEAGMTVSTLSQIERDIITPSISSLRRIAAVLGVPAFYFLIEESDLDGMVVRCDERRTLRFPGYSANYQLLSPSLDKLIEVIAFELAPGEKTCESPMAHEGEECLTVLSGRLKVLLPDQEVILEAGDSIYFERSLPHQLTNVGDTAASAICAISPPSF